MTLLSLLKDHVGDDTIQRLSEQIDASPDETGTAVKAILPVLVGAFAKNTEASGSHAQALANALDRDHDGTLLDNVTEAVDVLSQVGAFGKGRKADGGFGGALSAVSSLFGGATSRKAVDGAGILGHVLGDRRTAVVKGVSAVTGLDNGQVDQLLKLLAPIVMSALARVKSERNLDASGLARLLQEERSTIESNTPDADQGSLLRVLDADQDGSIADDVAGFLKKYL